MNKSDDKLNILRDIRVYDYVADDQESASREQFEKALNDDSELQNEVEIERELRSLIGQTQPSSPVSADNIDALFDRIDEQEKIEVNDDSLAIANSSNVHTLAPKKSVIGFAVAASLFMAIFLTTNFNNSETLLAPEFTTLTSKNSDSEKTIDFDSLVNQNRVVTVVFSSSASAQDIELLMNKYQLQQLSQQYPNQSIITAHSDKSIDDVKLSNMQSEQLIEDSELFKF